MKLFLWGLVFHMAQVCGFSFFAYRCRKSYGHLFCIIRLPLLIFLSSASLRFSYWSFVVLEFALGFGDPPLAWQVLPTRLASHFFAACIFC